ncbi:MAG: protein kinase [Magnetococcales bacterium]|nr:protein kinase [Magnetococcales bacterium]
MAISLLLEDGTLKVADFGIARVSGSDLTQMGNVMGTPGYMSPEQVQGESADHRSDLFSAGVILYELLTGRRPFPGKEYPTFIHQVLSIEPKPASILNPNVSPMMDQVLGRALHKDREQRFQSGAELLQAFLNALDNIDPQLPPLTENEEDETLISINTPNGHGADGETIGLPPQMLEEHDQHAPSTVSMQATPTTEPATPPKRRVGLMVAAGIVTALATGLVFYQQQQDSASKEKTDLAQSAPPEQRGTPATSKNTTEKPSSAKSLASTASETAEEPPPAKPLGSAASEPTIPRPTLSTSEHPSPLESSAPSGPSVDSTTRQPTSQQEPLWVKRRRENMAHIQEQRQQEMAPWMLRQQARVQQAQQWAKQLQRNPNAQKKEPTEPAMGWTNLTTTPQGAHILINNIFAGTTPTRLKLPPGAYDIILKMDGFQSLNTQLTIEAGSGTPKSYTLKPITEWE